MEDTMEKLLHGTAAGNIEHGEKGFEKIGILLEATGGLSLSQVCAVTGLEGSTIQNWVKRGWVAHPKGKKYEEVHIARILIINELKECIKLEHIALLMTYINGEGEDSGGNIIKESAVYNYLCSALQRLGQAEDFSRGGIESVVQAVIKDYKGTAPSARFRIRKALTVMIYACVCTNVKRRTEAMMQQVLHELENPDSVTEEIIASELQEAEKPETEDPEPAAEKAKPREETRKTVAQALREWDLERVESILNEESESDEESSGSHEPDNASTNNVSTTVRQPEPIVEKPAQKPWYFRRN